MLFVVHALDKKDILPTRAKHYRDHRIHLDRAGDLGVDVITAGTLVADVGETPAGSIFVLDAQGRAAVDAFTVCSGEACAARSMRCIVVPSIAHPLRAARQRHTGAGLPAAQNRA